MSLTKSLAGLIELELGDMTSWVLVTRGPDRLGDIMVSSDLGGKPKTILSMLDVAQHAVEQRPEGDYTAQ